MKKPIKNPDHISLLLPTRARVDKLINAFDSIEETTEDKSQMDVWVYVDEDDEATREWMQSGFCDKYGFKISFYIGERTKTLVETCNILWRESTTNAGIYMPAGDDFKCITHGWDRVVRDAFKEYPDRIMLAYAVDISASLDDMLFPVLSAEWVNLLGYVFTGYFPFWFEDIWLDEIAMMIQRRKRLDMLMQPMGGKGKTNRMKNVPFWYRFFNNMRDERMEVASRLRKSIFSEDSVEYIENEAHVKDLVKDFIERNKEFDDARCKGWETKLALIPKSYTPEYVKNYLSVEAGAVNLLIRKLDVLMNKWNIPELLDVLDNILYASQKINDIQYLRAVYLSKSGRLAEAQQAAEEELFLQPGDVKTVQLLEEIQSKIAAEDLDGIVKQGLVYFRQGNYEMSYRKFVTVSYQYPHYAPGHALLGLTLIGLGRHQEAESVLKRAFDLDPQNFDALFGLGKLYFDVQRYSEARFYLQSAAKIKPNDREVWVGLALVEQRINQM